MNFVCSITHTLIKKNNPVRIFFIESHNDPVFPFLNYNQPESVGHFKPLGCAFKAKFADDDHNEYFSFDKSEEKSILEKTLLDYINDKLISKEEAKDNNLLSHNSEDISWDEINDLDELFERCRDQSVYLKKDKKFKFVSVMVMHESAYQTMLKHSNIDDAISRFEKLSKEEEFILQKDSFNSFINNAKKTLFEKKGEMHKALLPETIIIDEDFVKETEKRLEKTREKMEKKMKILFSPEEIEKNNKYIQKLRNEIGCEKRMMVDKERFIDDDYIEFFIYDFKKTLLANNPETKAIKESAFAENSANFVASQQITELLIEDSFTKKEWLSVLEAYLIEVFMTYSGFEFMPSRRHFKNIYFSNKAFFKDLVELKVYK